MEFSKMRLKGPIVISTNTYEDIRGTFVKVYAQREFAKNSIKCTFLEHFYSFSMKRTIRGMHYQSKPHEQDKLVYVIRGKIMDVVLDIRKNSETFGYWDSRILSESNGLMMFVPKGFAHGFQALKDSIVGYLCSGEYNEDTYTGIRWNDNTIKIKWMLKNPIISERDKKLPLLNSK